MRSLVLGATGIVGGHIVDQLVRAGERPLALSRSPPPDHRPVTWVRCDLADPDDLHLPSFSTLFCTAHAGLLAGALPRLFQPDLRRVVLFTSTSIATKINSTIESERNGLRRLAEGEHQTRAMCGKLGVSWTVLRPTLIYDEGRDINVTRLAGLIRRFGVMPLSGAGAGLRQPVHAEDLAIGALDAASSPAAANKVYDLPGGDTVSYREMVERIFDGLNKPRRIVRIPPVLWRTGFWLARPLISNANVAMGDRMAKNMTFDAEPARRDFGWTPRGFHPRFC